MIVSPEIVVRPYRPIDFSAIQELHKSQGLDYEAPDWNKMLVSAVIEVDGKIEMAAFLRKTAETYLLLDPRLEISKKGRIGQLLILHRELVKPCQRAELTDAHCWLPPGMEANFGPLLMNFGWKKQLWPVYRLEVK